MTTQLRSFILIATLVAGTARAQTSITPPPTPIIASGITLALTPLVTMPADTTLPQYDPAAGIRQPLDRILYATPSPDKTGRIFVNDISGVLYQTSQTGAAPTTYLDLRAQGIGFTAGIDPGSPGFNGFAFHPNFNGDPNKPGYGKFYTTSWLANDGTNLTFNNSLTGNSATAGSIAATIREWTTTDPNAATFTGTSREVMRIAGYTSGHSNGMIAFNPTAAPGDADYGNLYIGSGDGQYWDPAANAQNMALPQGKILRINPLRGPAGQPYTVPTDNPFTATAGTLPEIWASGLRNPQSFTWDSATGKMFINDIGQNLFEEVDVGVAGANYGWPYREGDYAKNIAFGGDPTDETAYTLPGNDAAAGFTYPVCGYAHNAGHALGSGILYRGSAIPELDGTYVMTDIVNGRLYACDPAQATAGSPAPLSELLVEQDGALINIDDTYGYQSWLTSPRVDDRLSTDADGNLLVLQKSTGEIFTLSDAPAIPEPTSLTLLGGALVGLGARRQRLKRGARRTVCTNAIAASCAATTA